MDIIIAVIGVWLSLVERNVRDVEAASSNLVTPTIFSLHESDDEARLTEYLRIQNAAERHAFFLYIGNSIERLLVLVNYDIMQT